MRLLALLLIALVTLTGCTLTGVGDRRPAQVDLDEVASLALLELPAGSELTSSEYQAFQDWHLTATVAFPASQLDAFLADNGLDAVPGLRAVTDGDRSTDADDRAGASSPTPWTPDAASDVLGVDEAEHPVDGVYRRMLFDLDDPETITLYLVAFTT